MNKKARVPFLVVNPKNYLYGKESLELATAADQVAKDLDIQVYFTCPYTDARMISENTEYITVTAQNMDSLVPGRGVGKVLGEALKEAGVGALFLNHAENPKTVSELYKTVKRAKELEFITIVCADSVTEAKALSLFDPDVVLAEPTDLIGTGQTADDDYITNACKEIRAINPNVQPMIASGVSTADDCYHMVKLGADGTGATSGILNAADRPAEIRAWAEAILKAYKERTNG